MARLGSRGTWARNSVETRTMPQLASQPFPFTPGIPAQDFYANSDDKEVIREGGREIGVPIEDSLDDPADSGTLG